MRVVPLIHPCSRLVILSIPLHFLPTVLRQLFQSLAFRALDVELSHKHILAAELLEPDFHASQAW